MFIYFNLYKKYLNFYKKDLEVASITNNRLFSSLCNIGIILLDLKERDFSNEFDVSIPTVERWRRNINYPASLMRKPVYDWLIKLTENKIKVLEGIMKEYEYDKI